MTGRKKGRQRGAFGSKALNARHFTEALRQAAEELPRTQYRAPDPARRPPRLSGVGKSSLRALLCARALEDERGTLTARFPPPAASWAATAAAATSAPRNGFSKTPACLRLHPRSPASLASLCVAQIGRDFLDYDAADPDLRQAFSLLPPGVVSSISSAAARCGRVADHNLPLLCWPAVRRLSVGGPVTDGGAAAILPSLRAAEHNLVIHTAETALPEGEDWEESAGKDFAGGEIAAKKGRSSKDTTLDTPLEDTVSSEVGGACSAAPDAWEEGEVALAAAFGGCVSLTELALSSPLITTAFFASLARQCPTLRVLSLRGCFVDAEEEPPSLLRSIAELTALQELDVSGCRWIDDGVLGRWTRRICHNHEDADGLGADSGGGGGGCGCGGFCGGACDVSGSAVSGSAGSGGGSGAVYTAGRGGFSVLSFNLAATAAAAAGGEAGGVENESAALGNEAATRAVVVGRRLLLRCQATAVTSEGAAAAMRVSPALLVERE